MRILSGIQPSGELHIGNYLGAIKNWIKLQNEKNECWFFVADYHSLTENYNPKEKSKEILNLATDLLALGLDPKKSTIFQQSQIESHANLAWIFNTLVRMSELERMTQYKDKASIQKENVNIGLFGYPILMAADILIYKADAVPVGEDQIQHLELTRDIAHRFNEKFGQTFPEPKSLLTETPRIMSLLDPTKKMSKSGGEKSYIALTDFPEIIQEKIKSAVSDTGGGKDKRGGENLLEIFNAFAETKNGQSEYSNYKRYHEEGTLKYAEFKPALAELISNYFADYRAKRAELLENPDFVKNVLTEGNKKTSAIAEATLQEVKQKLGLII
ncbi:MAG: Tryptophan-tRNA ligase [Candidatus Azambacteria bacterium GW2011_GWE1_42_9]|nr:MAG: Tryptophan-tRNA ligase [Candidatus Azambacteria bacterium GW2011_GWF1_41_10]KKS49200.1 MAG: Tryptophan-tRNA ligase [Candidatus Azambacteria bacterium GW2011_GWF2_42_22]KKS79158.1 MAG: Tryptophan-tRNA ligase [Candidatus Azambacteria bacterium GW2011_GWE1_42_9]KKT03092.1 MAG: Tryptophan-tRNA ligase [Candidatus Azambacteria bacterium GW2011_GWD1_43_18]KKT12400.1 MAG: Tryptophan-tRNA ligase [Candidatus Azambacteria bacterium GW2011_GWC2_43_27]KKT17105.1 MAG: Tryptophan-tRNA ligase [Parcuba